MDSVPFYESSFLWQAECSEPERYTPGLSNSARPKNDFVISRYPNGDILSTYGDDIWDLWPYSTTAIKPIPLYFSSIAIEAREDIKWLIFILIYMADNGLSSTLSPNTLSQYMTLFRRLALFAQDDNTTPCKVLETESALRRYALQVADKGCMARLLPLLTLLFSIGTKRTGIGVVNETAIADCRDLYRAHKAEHEQHAVIPPRIFSEILTQCWNIIDIVDKHKNNIGKFLTRCISDRTYARNRYTQKHMGLRKSEYSVFFNEAIQEHSLCDFVTHFKIKNLVTLTSFLHRLQHVCKELMHAYSGMRHNEVLSLKVDCFHEERDSRGKIAHLLGETSKLVGQRKTAAWITSFEIKKVIDILQLIAKIVAKSKGLKAEQTPLFISISCIRLEPGEIYYENEIGVNMRISESCNHSINLLDNLPLAIRESDIQDLEKVNPLRSWRDDQKFKIGHIWKTTTHQWRRSLAFYVAQSGIVSLPTLKRQLKHISREMSIYYSNGAGFSDLFNDREHFSNELRATKPEADALAYIYNVILSDEPLNGTHGRHLMRQHKLRGIDNNILLENRSKTVSMFRKGELAYKETALGACTAIERCDKKLLRSITACIRCPSAVIKPSKVSRTIERQKILLSELDIGSVEYRTEQEELNCLIELQKSVT